LDDLIEQKGRTFQYLYDFGDNWAHEVILEDSRYIDPRLQFPVECLEGERAPYAPDVIHGMSDVPQAYHLGNDWCAAHDSHPFHMVMTMNSSVCHGCVRCRVTGEPNITPMCSSSKTAGKTEQSEINWIWPDSQLEPTVRWMLHRIVRDGGVSFPRTGETYPGFDICKLCSFLVFKKPKASKTGTTPVMQVAS
jgi:hypothetical protein